MSLESPTDWVWIPATPEPWFGFRSLKCQCGKRFRGSDKRGRYEAHWHEAHGRAEGAEVFAQMCVFRSVAEGLGYTFPDTSIAS